MNKFLTKLAKLFIGISMAAGVGVAVGSGAKSIEVRADDTYEKVTSVSDISTGDTIIIVYENGATSKCLSTISTTSTKYGYYGDASISNDKITLSSSSKVAELTVVANSNTNQGAFYLQGKSTNPTSSNQQTDSSKNTAINDTKYLHWVSGNSLTVVAQNNRTANSSWDFSLVDSSDSTKGVKITNGYDSARLIRYNTTSGQYRFACYNGSTGDIARVYKKASAKTLSSITLGGTYPSTFVAGDTFSHSGMTVTANYSDLTSANVTSSATWSSPNMASAGQKTVTVSYTEGGSTQTYDYNITVKELSSISVSTSPTKVNYTEGEYFDPTGLVITRTCSDNSTDTYTYADHVSEFTFSPSTSTALTTSHSSVTITFRTKTTDQAINVTGIIAVSSVTLAKDSTSIEYGSTETLQVTVEPSNASNKNIVWTSSDDDIATVDSSGVVTAVAEGTATITAESAADNTKYDTCEVTVTIPASATITYKDVEGMGTQSTGSQMSVTKSFATLTVSKGYGNTDYFHVYKSSTMTISSTLTFTKIELTDSGDSNYSLSGFGSVSGYSNGVWTGESKSITFTASNKQVRMSQIKVTYKTTAVSVDILTYPAYLVDGGSSASLSATITNDSNYTITWSASPNTGVTISPSTSSSGGNVTISFDGTTTGTSPIAITATLNDTKTTASSPVNIYSLAHAGTSADPFTATDAQVFASSNYANQSGGDYYVEGYVVGTYYNSQSVLKGYYIDESSTATSSTKFEVYDFTNSTGKEIIVADGENTPSYIVAHGAMKTYNGQAEFESSTITSVSNAENTPSIAINGGNRTVDIGDSVTLTVTKEYDGGATVSWASSDESVATVSDGVLTLLKAGSTDITASMTVDAVEYSSTITVAVIKQAFSVGDEIYFYAEYDSTTYYMCAVGGTSSSSTTEADKIVFTVVAGSVDGSVAFKHGDDYLKCTGSTPYSGSSTTLDADTSWMAIDEGTNIVITTCGTQTGRKLMWNYNNGNSPRFGCYGTPSATMLLVSAGVALKPTTVSLSENSVTLENGSSTTLTYTSDNAGTFKWTSSVESVATVTDGLVECLANSGTTTIRIYFDTNGNNSYDDGEPTDTCVVTACPAQIDFGAANYGGIATRIDADSTGTSLGGKKIIFGCASEGTVSGALSGKIIDHHDTDEAKFDVSYDSTNHKFTIGNGLIDTEITVFTLNSISANTYSISAEVNGETKYLKESTVKNLAYDENPYSWTISISSGTATIQSTNGYLKYNASSPRFTTYASGQTDIEIYEYKSYYDEATEYAETFVGGSSGECSATISNWSSLSETYSSLTTGAKNIYKNATHLDSASYNHELTIEHAVARYDDAIIKHAELRTNEFMHRFETGGANANYQFSPKVNLLINVVSENTNTVAIIVIISVVSVTAIGGYFFLRKRKENN